MLRLRVRLLPAVLLLLGCAAPMGESEPGLELGPKADEASSDAAAWVVGLYDGDVYCTGSLVGARTVLTAAHCLLRTPTHVHFGAELDEAGLVEIASVVRHPEFSGSDEDPSIFAPLPVSHDVALLVLAEDADVAPVTLNGGEFDGYTLGQSLVGAGWADRRSAFGGEPRSLGFVRDTLSLFSELEFESLESTLCQGDSGGPTYVVMDGQPVQLGITSWGDPGCRGRNRSMRVDAYRSFIDETMAEHADAARYVDVPAHLRGDRPTRPWPTPGPGFDFSTDEWIESTVWIDEPGEVGDVHVFADVAHRVSPLVQVQVSHAGRTMRLHAVANATIAGWPRNEFAGTPRAGAWTLRVRVAGLHGGGHVRAWGVGLLPSP